MKLKDLEGKYASTKIHYIVTGNKTEYIEDFTLDYLEKDIETLSKMIDKKRELITMNAEVVNISAEKKGLIKIIVEV